MKSLLRNTLLAASGIAMVACSHGQTTSQGEKVFKPSSSFRLPSFDEKTLPNGLTILYVPDESLPYVSYSVLVKGGSSTDPKDEAGLTSFVADLLDQGTSKHNAPELADALASHGSEFDAAVNSDYSLFSTSSLTTDAEPLAELFNEIITQPTFTAAEVERARMKTVAQLKKRIDVPDAFIDVAWDEDIFGAGNPYAQPGNGTVKSVQSFRRKNIIQQYLKYFRPNNSILSVVGKITPELRSKVESLFGQWEKRDVVLPTLPEVPKFQGMQILLVNKPGLVQSQIRLGNAGIKRNNPDFLTLRVANTILGGAFSSRLVNHVRRDLGLTYSISSAFDARQGQGIFEISTFTKNQSLGKTIEETMKVLHDFHDKGVSEDEVEGAKGYLAGVFPTSIETPEKLAFNLMILRLYGISDNYLKHYLSNLSDIDASEVNKAIKAHIDADDVKVVAFTSAADVAPQVKAIKGATVTVKKAAEYQ